MPGNHSLDEFAGGETGEDEAERPADSPDGGVEPGVEPIAETYAWSADGGACARCDEPVEARWRDGDDLVCAGCKAW